VHSTHAAAGSLDPAWRARQSDEQIARVWPEIERYLDAVIPAVHPRHTNAEGRVHTILCSGATEGLAVIDREAAVCFTDNREKQTVLTRLASRYHGAIASAGTGGAWWRAPRTWGTGCDVVAMDGDGRLLVVEVKGATDTKGITWAPVQVGIYADLFRQWASQDSHTAVEVLRRMLGQRVRLGLSPDFGVKLREPLEIVPVVVIGGQVRSQVALARLAEVQRELIKAGVGWRNLAVCGVDGVGRLTPITTAS
jgi:hypothetical protein